MLRAPCGGRGGQEAELLLVLKRSAPLASPAVMASASAWRGPVSSGPETQASGLSLAEARRALRGNSCPEITNFGEQLTPVLLPSEVPRPHPRGSDL